jgi:CRISPR/Cas system-associated exonuclease Cas4 (RecB family)
MESSIKSRVKKNLSSTDGPCSLHGEDSDENSLTPNRGLTLKKRKVSEEVHLTGKLEVKPELKKDDKPAKARGGKVELKTLIPDVFLPKGYLSFSAISTYLKCPRQFEFAYVQGIKNPPAVALVEGSSIHESLEATNKEHIGNKKYLPTKVMQEIFADSFSDNSKEIPSEEWEKSGLGKDDVIHRGKALLKEYADITAPKITPVAVEKSIEILMGGVPVVGFIDLVDKNGVLDYKTTSKSKSQAEADSSLQLSIYAEAENMDSVGFCSLIKTKTPKVEIIRSHRDLGDRLAAGAVIKSVADAIKKGAFPMTDPSNTFPCSEKWCGYYHLCRGKYKNGK